MPYIKQLTIKLKEGKTHCIVFTKQHTNIRVTNPLRINNAIINALPKIKYLGILLDKHVNMRLIRNERAAYRKMYTLIGSTSRFTHIAEVDRYIGIQRLHELLIVKLFGDYIAKLVETFFRQTIYLSPLMSDIVAARAAHDACSLT